MTASRDPRWVLLAETGEYSTLGRHREPGVEEIAAAEDALIRAGRAGWLAIMSPVGARPRCPRIGDGASTSRSFCLLRCGCDGIPTATCGHRGGKGLTCSKLNVAMLVPWNKSFKIQFPQGPMDLSATQHPNSR